MDDLEEGFVSRGIVRGGTLFLAAAHAIELIDTAKTQGRRVLGVDTFILGENETRPLLDHILDLSSPPANFDSWSTARRFIEERADEGYMFEVVV